MIESIIIGDEEFGGAGSRLIASLDVDPQKGFTPLCPAELPVVGGDEIVDELNANKKFADLHLASKDAHPMNPIWVAKHPQEVLQPISGENVDLKWPLHCVVGTMGFEFLDGLPHPSEYDFVAYKGMEPDMHPYGACFHTLSRAGALYTDGRHQSTGLIEFMKEWNVGVVIVGGLATDYCVKETVLQLLSNGFEVIVNLGACRGVTVTSTEKAIQEMDDAGAVIVKNSQEIIDKYSQI